jgi:hypothetical protein
MEVLGGREARARSESGGGSAKATRTITQKMSTVGLPGERQRIGVHNEFIVGDVRHGTPVGGGPGRYRVVLTLSRPGFEPIPETEFSFDPKIPGDSHLAIAAPAIMGSTDPATAIRAVKIYSASSEGEIVLTGYPNSKGYLGRIETELDATSLVDAEQRAYRALAVSLSNWSAHLDIPLHIWRIHVMSIETESVQVTVTNPFIESPLATNPTGAVSAACRGFLSLYREALESNSPVYQYLCLFKIAEGILRRRERLAVEAKARQEKLSRPVERIPEHEPDFIPWLNALFPIRRAWDEMALASVFVPAARGRKIKDVIDHELTDLRVDVAHALSSETGTMAVSADEILHVDRVNQWLGLMKCIARRMLKNEFPTEFLSYLQEDGTIVDTAAAFSAKP